MNKLASWETLTGTRPTIESDRSITTVSFPPQISHPAKDRRQRCRERCPCKANRDIATGSKPN